LPFDIAPVQIAFILIGENEELINYYQEIYESLSPHFRCQLYNKNKQFNLNILQADKEGCPFKIIIGKTELEKKEITLVRRDNVERKITIIIKDNETDQKLLVDYEKYMEDSSKFDDEEVKKELVKMKKKSADLFKRGMMAGKIFKVITKEIEEFKKVLYQKSAEFRDKHIFPVDNYQQLEEKIKDGVKGLFLIPFCNNLDCEVNIKKRVPSYTIRCIVLEKKPTKSQKCLFCQLAAQNMVYLGRSY